SHLYASSRSFAGRGWTVSLPRNLRQRFALSHRSLDRALHFPEFHASFRRSTDAGCGKRFHRRRHQEHRAELRPNTTRLGGKLPPRLAPLCRSLRRTFPANVAILSAQLRGRISGAQSAGLFDSLFETRHREDKLAAASPSCGGRGREGKKTRRRISRYAQIDL